MVLLIDRGRAMGLECYRKVIATVQKTMTRWSYCIWSCWATWVFSGKAVNSLFYSHSSSSLLLKFYPHIPVSSLLFWTFITGNLHCPNLSNVKLLTQPWCPNILESLSISIYNPARVPLKNRWKSLTTFMFLYQVFILKGVPNLWKWKYF